MLHSDYQTSRPEMATGDLIAFGGTKRIDRIVKWATKSPVSHAASLVQVTYTGSLSSGSGHLNLIVESAASGVQVSRLSGKLEGLEGEVWWLPLGSSCRDKFDEGKFLDWLFRQVGKPYDVRQAIKSALDRLDEGKGRTYNYEDFTRFFCSELSAAAYEASGLVGPVNASEVTPIDLCRWNIYEDTYFMLQGNPSVEIKGYNMLDPSLWNY